jgi:3-demethoxyubiquinol 3-hydroxylase
MDTLITALDNSLRTVLARPRSARPCPKPAGDTGTDLSASEQKLSAALMRVNHVGEICAQALYTAQALGTRDPAVRAQLRQAAQEETDHLAWTADRIEALGGRTSRLNPLWYAGAFAIGLAASRLGDRVSLGFVSETERQVEAHLASHLDRLPPQDLPSRAIVAAMRDDEARHGQAARDAGGVEPPAPVRAIMRLAARVMTSTAHHI